MNPSVSPEAEWELTEEAVYYAKEGGADLGVAFIDEFERAVSLLCTQPKLGAE
jgi:hypothetical protein